MTLESFRKGPFLKPRTDANIVSKHRDAAHSFKVLYLFSPGFRRLLWVLPDKYPVSSPFFLDFHSPHPADYTTVRL